MARRPRVSPDRILAAAAVEFAARGYAGARVDEIARRARVNKAMLYYHFASKQGLYRTLLRTTFAGIAAPLQAIAAQPLPPADRLDRAVDAMAAFVAAHPHFPSIMLREAAEGGGHLDRQTLDALAAVPRAFADILQSGIDQGAFRRMHPLAAYFTTIAPVLMFVASTPVRRQLSATRLLPGARTPLSRARFVADLKASLRRGFAAPEPSSGRESS
jgi:TetR/AcrR family transcriptional regulator